MALILAASPGSAEPSSSNLGASDLGASLVSLESLVAERSANLAPLSADIECMAKAVVHEAGDQPLAGQLAVAQTIVNRTKSGRFPASACAVINQPGQFFQTARYSVGAASRRWRTAVAISLLAAEERLAQVVPGALFFHAARAPAMGHGRVRVAQIGGQVFYR